MKKALTKVMLTAIAIVIFAAIVPLSASASTSNKTEIFKQLTTKLDLNPAAACGIMANIEHESNFNPSVVIIDSNGLPSGGLCQWNGGRFSNLQSFCYNNGFNYLSIEGQIAYLTYEMKSNSFSHIYNYLKNVPNNATGAYNAAWYWCYYFEIPSNRDYQASQRGSYASSRYWPTFGQVDLKAPTLSLNNKKTTYDIDNPVPLKWSNGGNDADYYYLYVTAKNSKGKYDWSKAKVSKLNSNTTAKTLAAKSLKKGEYAAYVQACNTTTGKTAKSNYTKFTVKCLTHQYKKTSTVPATFKKEGKIVSTCKQCSAKKTTKIPKLTYKGFAKLKVNNITVKGYTDSYIELKWTPVSGAEGYRIYQKFGSKWKCVATVKGEKATVGKVRNLSAGKKYSLNVKAYKYDSNGKLHTSSCNSPITAATRPSTPGMRTLKTTPGKATATWAKVNGADGYMVYMAKGQNSTNFKRIATISGNGKLTYSATNLKKGDFCYVAVRSFIKTSDGYALSKMSQAKYVVIK